MNRIRNTRIANAPDVLAPRLVTLGINYWDGRPFPQPGDYMVSTARRPRNGYQMVTVSLKEPHGRGKLVCRRFPIADMPEGALYWELTWSPRKKKKQGRSPLL